MATLDHFRKGGWIAQGITQARYGNATEKFLLSSSIVRVPWGISPSEKPRYDNRTISLASIGSTHSTATHNKRKAWQQDIAKVPDAVYGSIYGSGYAEVLRRTNVLVVDTAQSGIVTQKYLEGADAGCLLYGEVPALDTETFAGAVVPWVDGPRKDLVDQGYMSSIWTLTQKGIDFAMAARNRILSTYHMDHAVNAFLEGMKWK
jgi:hypothetical protein